jgi:hypothetical protein
MGISLTASQRRTVALLIGVGIITTLLGAGVCIGLTFVVKYYAFTVCQTESTNLDTFVTDILNQTVIIPSISDNFTTGFPNQFLLDTTVQTQYGPAHVDANISLPLPEIITVKVGPFSLPMEQLVSTVLGPNSVADILSSPSTIDYVCSTYLLPTIYITGILITIGCVWLSILTFTLAVVIYIIKIQLAN